MQNISGLGLNMMAAGLTSFFCRSMFKTALSPSVASIQSMPWLARLPVIGPVLSQFSPILLLLIAIFIATCYIMGRSVAGLRIIAVGSDPQTVETAGINVWKLKHICVIACGALAGLAGAYLSIGQLNIFMENMTMGKGMLAVIAVTIGRRRPLRTVIVALLFGVFDALQLQIQISGITDVPPELIQAIPYAAAILAMALDFGKKLDDVNMRPYLKNRYKF
jgi:simple sugar transport system permease protein